MDISMLKDCLGEDLYAQAAKKLDSLTGWQMINDSDGSWVPRDRMDAEISRGRDLKAKLDDMAKQLQQASAALAEKEDVQARADQLARDVEERDKTIAAMKRSDKVREALVKADIRDAVIGEKLLDMTKITDDGTGRLKGLEEQIKALRETSPFLFADPHNVRAGFEARSSPAHGMNGTDDHADVNAAIRAAAGRNY